MLRAGKIQNGGLRTSLVRPRLSINISKVFIIILNILKYILLDSSSCIKTYLISVVVFRAEINMKTNMSKNRENSKKNPTYLLNFFMIRLIHILESHI